LDSHISLIQKFLESDISIHLALRGGLRVTWVPSLAIHYKANFMNIEKPLETMMC
jgi:hypothetical protein